MVATVDKKVDPGQAWDALSYEHREELLHQIAAGHDMEASPHADVRWDRLPSNLQRQIMQHVAAYHGSWPEFKDKSSKRAKGSVRKAFGDKMRDIARSKAAMAESVGATGGYLVPEELLLDVNTILREESLFFALAYVQPMAHKVLHLPGVDISASHVAGESPLFGGISLLWAKEAADMTAQALETAEPGFLDVQLTANDLTAYCVASNQLIDDGGEPLGAYLERLFALGIDWKTERDFFQGSGVGRPLGLVNSPGAVVIARQTTVTVTSQDLGKMMGALIPACYKRAVWACNPTALVKIAQLSQYSTNISQFLPGLAGSLFGRPLFVTEKLPVVGTQGDIILFDPQMYAVGVRGVEVAVSPHPKFNTNQSIYRVVWRGDGQPLAKNTVTLADGSTLAGVAVMLSTL